MICHPLQGSVIGPPQMRFRTAGDTSIANVAVVSSRLNVFLRGFAKQGQLAKFSLSRESLSIEERGEGEWKKIRVPDVPMQRLTGTDD